jgi:uncharacterized membrane protein
MKIGELCVSYILNNHANYFHYLIEQILDLFKRPNLLNADKHKNHEANRRMNTKYLVVVAAMTAMLVAATALATDSAFADKKRHDDKKKGYEKSQAVSQVNDCGNGFEPIDVWCQNLASQIQGDNNAAALEGEQD